MTTPSAMALRKLNDFRWDVFDIIIGGKSSIDSREGFSVGNAEDAGRFLLSYGFDLANPIEAAEALGHFHEALNFIRKYFLAPENADGLRIEVPRKILELTDVRDLFLYASFNSPGQQRDSQGMLLKNWSCSILKVMHTIAHIDQDLRVGYFAEIQKQILDRFYRLIQRDEKGSLYFGTGPDDESKIALVEFQTKPKKSRDSTLLKLLHKPENVAEDIFDRVGIRFVTTKAIDALRIVKYLKDQMVVMPPNIKPSRSRNTLIDLESFRSELAESLRRLDSGEYTETQFELAVEEAARPPIVSPDNPHTSEFYRSIQFTCRQLIKLRNPLYGDLKELKAIGKKDGEGVSEELAKLIEKIDLKNIQRDVRFFYPYEIQVVDIRNHEQNERGRSAHSEYKKAQLQTAMRRVMGALADASR
ncbi:MAG: TIGR04552 family protein [Bdellovibrionales bacterium]|nr:TIGR04552 family protein [Bdellovibrionales bacterium]